MPENYPATLACFLRLFTVALVLYQPWTATAGECTEEQVPCQLLEGLEAPWEGILMTYAQLASYEAGLDRAEKQVAQLIGDLDKVAKECQEGMDEMQVAYEARIVALQTKLVNIEPVTIDTCEWYDYLLAGAIGVAIGAVIVGAIWFGNSLSLNEGGAVDGAERFANTAAVAQGEQTVSTAPS